ncbi:MAG: ATP synthase F1 subunit epsilon [Gemmatimonadales bacterium]
MRLTVISPERAVFDGDVDAVVAPAYDGEVGILPRHAPFMTLLGSGRLTIRSGGETRTVWVEGGFLQVVNDVVRVVAEHAREKTDNAS